MVERKIHTNVSCRCRVPPLDNTSATIPPNPKLSQQSAVQIWCRGPSSTSRLQQGKSTLPSHPRIFVISGSSRTRDTRTDTTKWNFQDTESQPGLASGLNDNHWQTIQRDVPLDVQSLKMSDADTKSISNVSNKNTFLDSDELNRSSGRRLEHSEQPFEVNNHLLTFVRKLFWHKGTPNLVKRVTACYPAHRRRRPRKPKQRRGDLYAIRDTVAYPSTTTRVTRKWFRLALGQLHVSEFITSQRHSDYYSRESARRSKTITGQLDDHQHSVQPVLGLYQSSFSCTSSNERRKSAPSRRSLSFQQPQPQHPEPVTLPAAFIEPPVAVSIPQLVRGRNASDGCRSA